MLNSKGAIRVLIIDQQPVVRFGLRRLLDDDPALNVVGEAGDMEELERLLDETRPDVLLVDPGSDDRNGLESLRGLWGKLADCRVIIYTARADRDQIMTALELGVSGYLLKDGSLEELLHDIRRGYAGGAVFAPAVASRLVEHFSHKGRSQEKDPGQRLSHRELEVLTYLAQGKSNRAIAKSLHVCEATVKFHVHAILEKLNAGNRTEAVSIAAQRGLVDLGADLQGDAD